MKLVSWNVNGIRSIHKKNLFVPFLEQEKPDIVCLQETKAQQAQSEVDLPEYDEYWSSAKKKGYSGTAIFTKIAPESVISGLPDDIKEQFHMGADAYGDPNDEGRITAVELENVFVVTVYTPNSKDDLSRVPLRHRLWDPAFLAFLKRLEEQKPVIFCGDLNVAHTEDDLANPKQNEGRKGFTKEEREGIDRLEEAGFVDTFRMFTKGNGHYTWWSHFSNARERNVGWRIDYFFVSRDLAPLVTRAKIHPNAYGSDHCPISLELAI